MNTGSRNIFWICSFLALAPACKEPYSPPVVPANPGFLVVDGFLNADQAPTTIRLSRTRALNDSAALPESRAQVFVTSQSGARFSLNETSPGAYSTNQLSLQQGEIYQLNIITADNRSYQSDTFPVLQSPEIDSLSWQQDSVGVSIYAYTHDPVSQTRYYRWDYEETWQYRAGILSLIDWDGSRVFTRNSSEQVYYCWKNASSTSIVVGTTANMTTDTINHQLVAEVEKGSEKISMAYCILVNQYALTGGAFTYWAELKKLTELTGSLFDPMPSQVSGNIHCLTNPKEPVLGYIGASTVTHKRIFVNNLDLRMWYYYPYYIDCLQASSFRISISPLDIRHVELLDEYLLGPDALYTLIDFPNSAVYILAPKYCADCREHGGVNTKPSFWP